MLLARDKSIQSAHSERELHRRAKGLVGVENFSQRNRSLQSLRPSLIELDQGLEEVKTDGKPAGPCGSTRPTDLSCIGVSPGALQLCRWSPVLDIVSSTEQKSRVDRRNLYLSLLSLERVVDVWKGLTDFGRRGSR